MNKLLLLCLLVLLPFTNLGCTKNPTAVVAEESPRPVRVLEIKEEVYPRSLEYIGTVDAKELKRYGFIQGGKLTTIFVQEGQKVQKGNLLAQLDTQDQNLALEAALNTLTKAISNYEFLEENHGKIRSLYDSGAISKQDFDNSKLELDVAEVNLKNSLVEYEHKLNMLEETQIHADIDGYVVAVNFKEGEIVGQGHPVIVVRNQQSVINIGIPQEEIDKVREGIAQIMVNGQQLYGRVAHIGELPDLKSRTYNGEIHLKEDINLPIGSIARVTVFWGEDRGMAIPIISIMNKGKDFVFVVQDQRIKKRNVQLGRILDNYVLIQGLENGDLVVVEGLKYVSEGDRVSVLK